MQQVNLFIDVRESIPSILLCEWSFTGNTIVENPCKIFTLFYPYVYLRIGWSDVLYTMFYDLSPAFYTRNRLYRGVILKKIRLLTLDVRNLHYWNEMVLLFHLIRPSDILKRQHIPKFIQLLQLSEPLLVSSLGLFPF